MNHEELSDLYENQALSLSELIERIKQAVTDKSIKVSGIEPYRSALRNKVTELERLEKESGPHLNAAKKGIARVCLRIICESIKTGDYIGIGFKDGGSTLEIIPINERAIQVSMRSDESLSINQFEDVQILISSQLDKKTNKKIEQHVLDIQKPNFEYWGELPEWPAIPACQLICNIEPDKTLNTEIANPDTKTRPDWVNLYHLLVAAVNAKKINHNKSGNLHPGEFISWARNTSYVKKIPEGLKGLVESAKPDAEVSEKERTSLYKMILAMAAFKYGYKPDVKKNSATGDKNGSIANDIEKLGLSLDSETIRTHLTNANEALDPTYPPDLK